MGSLSAVFPFLFMQVDLICNWDQVWLVLTKGLFARNRVLKPAGLRGIDLAVLYSTRGLFAGNRG